MYHLGSALCFKSGKIPRIGKTRALGGLDRLYPALIGSIQENARAIRFLNQTKPLPVRGQARKSVHERSEGLAQESGDGIGFAPRKADIARPAAAIPAPDALSEGAHRTSTTDGS
jgi:hypothetical protein